MFAQKTFRAGILAGINGSQVHGDSYSGFNAAGPVGGLFISTNPEKTLYFQLELQYSMKGSRKNINPEKGDYDFFQLRMNYIEVPLLMKYNYRNVFFTLGASYGTLFKVREWDDYGEITPRDFKKWELALVTGIGYNISETWRVDFRYTNSLIPIKNFIVPAYYPNPILNIFNRGMYNNVLGLTLCYTFPVKTTE
ncbi:MAG: hypothetical protein Fur0041_10390 [Bacteroidia bacterium]